MMQPDERWLKQQGYAVVRAPKADGSWDLFATNHEEVAFVKLPLLLDRKIDTAIETLCEFLWSACTADIIFPTYAEAATNRPMCDVIHYETHEPPLRPSDSGIEGYYPLEG